jgi:putative toxin-antitoxin system antitoxin component (TIGR02293 family)
VSGQDVVLRFMDLISRLPASVETSVRVRRVLDVALDVWSDWEDAFEFLSTSHPLLDGVAPIECLATDKGESAVMSILNAIRYGLPV